MDDVSKLMRRHTYVTKISTSFIYAILVSIAVNFFWTPGHIYSSGITGFAQLLTTISSRLMPFTISTGLGLFLLNIPLFLLSWRAIGHEFTIFTIITVFLSSFMIQLLKPIPLTHDPIICAIFGGAVNGFGTGLALRNGISTGGLDILGIVIRQRTGKSIGTINIAFNSLIIISAAIMYGWPYAFYSVLSLIVNARIMDMTYTRQQKMQVMIITNRPNTVIDSVQITFVVESRLFTTPKGLTATMPRRFYLPSFRDMKWANWRKPCWNRIRMHLRASLIRSKSLADSMNQSLKADF